MHAPRAVDGKLRSANYHAVGQLSCSEDVMHCGQWIHCSTVCSLDVTCWQQKAPRFQLNLHMANTQVHIVKGQGFVSPIGTDLWRVQTPSPKHRSYYYYYYYYYAYKDNSDTYAKIMKRHCTKIMLYVCSCNRFWLQDTLKTYIFLFSEQHKCRTFNCNLIIIINYFNDYLVITL